jgi:hypothetical protein
MRLWLLTLIALSSFITGCATFRSKSPNDLKEMPKAAAPLADSVALKVREKDFLGGAGAFVGAFKKAVAESGVFKTVIVTDSSGTASAADYQLESFVRVDNPGSRALELASALITGFSGYLIPSWDTYHIVNTLTLWKNGGTTPSWEKTYQETMTFVQWIVFVPAILYPPSWNGPANARAFEMTYRRAMADLVRDFPGIHIKEVPEPAEQLLSATGPSPTSEPLPSEKEH